MVCSGGDHFHLRMIDARGDWRFAALSQRVSRIAAPNVYWMNTSAAQMPGTNEYTLELSLIDTPRRELQHAEARTPHATSQLTWSLQDWLRDRKCAWQRVLLPRHQQRVRITFEPPPGPAPMTKTSTKSTSPAINLPAINSPSMKRLKC